ncbi:MAG: serine hydrolase [Gemmatimonadaceae bacterium]
MQSAAVMVVLDGIVVAAWGDVARKLGLHSVRKSVVSSLFGIAAARGTIDLDRTLGDIGISDRDSLTSQEKAARIRDLLAARSGIYLPAAYADRSQDEERPARGSHGPDTHFFYNNWDFNVLGVIYERVTGSSLYDSFAREVARPVGMEDYSPGDGFLVFEPSGSLHPAHTFRMSTRDLARFGQLYLNGGKWGQEQVIPRSWVSESTEPKSATGNRAGYGYLWWSRDPGSMGEAYPEANRRAMYYGTGTGGQLVLAIPSDNLVIVHRGDTDNGRPVSGRAAWQVVERILAAKVGEARGKPATMPLTPGAFDSQLPPLQQPSYVDIDSSLIAELSGEYEVAPGVVVRVFDSDGRLFGNFPGQGEAELFGLTRSEFTIRVQHGVRIAFTRDEAGKVTGFDAQIGRETFRGRRRR